MSLSYPAHKFRIFILFLSLLAGRSLYAADPPKQEAAKQLDHLPRDLKQYDIQDFVIAYGYVQGTDGLAKLGELETVKEAVIWRLIEFFDEKHGYDERFLVECALALEKMAEKEIEWLGNREGSKRKRIAFRLRQVRFDWRRISLLSAPKTYVLESSRGSGQRTVKITDSVFKALERAVKAWDRDIFLEKHRIAQLRAIRELADQKSINEFDLHRLADSRLSGQLLITWIDPVIEVRFALTLEALASAKLSDPFGRNAQEPNAAQRRRIAKKLWERARKQRSPIGKRAFHRAVAAWDMNVLIGEDAPPVISMNELLHKLAEETDSQTLLAGFDDVLRHAPEVHRMLVDKTERYPPEPPLAEMIPNRSMIATGADRRRFEVATTSEKLEMLRRMRPDASTNCAEILANALLDDDWRVRKRASAILWELGDDAELANALGYALRHDLAGAHIAELVDRIPEFPVYTLPLLRRCYTRDDSKVLAACLRAIQRIRSFGDSESVVMTHARMDGVRKVSVKQLLDEQSDQEEARTLVLLARTAKSADVRAKAFEIIGMRPRTKHVLREVLHHLVMGDEPRVEVEAAFAFLNNAPQDDPNRPQVAKILKRSTFAWINQEVSDMLATQAEAKRHAEMKQVSDLEDLFGLQD